MPDYCEYSFSADFVNRLRKYVTSREYQDVATYSKSEYWQHFSDVIDIRFLDNKVMLKGESGFYIPQRKDVQKRVKRNVTKLIREPLSLIPFLRRKIGMQTSEIKLLNYFDAFDKVMGHDRVANIVLSPNRINFKELAQKPGIISSVDDMRQQFFAKDKYSLNAQIVEAYYYYNLLSGFLDPTSIKTALEIGGGNGNLASLFYSSMDNCTIINVDLPKTLCLAIVFIADLFPQAKMLLPHEERSQDLNHYDFIFLTPKQIYMIEDNTIDLAINTDSFQEMPHRQISEYFKLIQRCCKKNAYFFTSNRVEKIPCGPNNQQETSETPTRFSDYPWDSANEVLVYEICRLKRLVQLDDVFIRLERVKK